MTRSKTITTVLAGAVIGAITLIGVTPIKGMVNKVRISKSAKTTPLKKKDEDDHFFI
jgi:formate hydrogenlyase subunit 3/multisubunit Na+/H+ antiporter MnhD subunit